jgi:hypothetical protein
MILTEKEIRDLLSKDFKQVKKTSSGEIFNQYTYEEKECLNLIESYIYERKGQKIGDIQSPSFALKQHGQLGGLVAQQRYNKMEIAFDKALQFYNEKYNKYG